MLPNHQQVVSPERFDELFEEQADIAKFANESEEGEYERRDSFLIHLIKKEVETRFGPECKSVAYVLEDWWPNHTRYLEVTPRHCTPEFFGALRDILAHDYRDYRIQLCVYGNIRDGKSYIGSMALAVDFVLIEEKLHELLFTQ